MAAASVNSIAGISHERPSIEALRAQNQAQRVINNALIAEYDELVHQLLRVQPSSRASATAAAAGAPDPETLDPALRKLLQEERDLHKVARALVAQNEELRHRIEAKEPLPSSTAPSDTLLGREVIILKVKNDALTEQNESLSQQVATLKSTLDGVAASVNDLVTNIQKTSQESDNRIRALEATITRLESKKSSWCTIL